MKRLHLLLAAAVAASAVTFTSRSAAQSTVTVYEGARLITGEGGAAIEDATVVVDGARFTQVGSAGQVKAPAGPTRVSLSGKTVMPGIIDTHTHIPDGRDAMIDALQRKAYFGV